MNGKDRIELSNGTVCLGWPIAVIDGPDGREIVADNKALHAALKRIADEHRTVVFAGQSNPNDAVRRPFGPWGSRNRLPSSIRAPNRRFVSAYDIAKCND